MSAEGIRGGRHWKIKKRDGSRLEPANLEVLRHWVETGQIGPDDHVINEDLADAPELVNSDPYGEAWLARIAVADAGELDDLMDAEAYAAFVAEEEAKGEH